MNIFNAHKVAISVLAITLCVPAFAGSSQHDTTEADSAAIHALVKNWSEAAQAKDLESFVSVYAEDGVVMLEGAPDLRGLEAIRAGIGGMMQDPNFNLSFEIENVVVAASGDLAYETGTYGLSLSDPEGKAVSQQGHYVVVWRKQPDGHWKVALDVPVSDPPETSD